MKGAHEITQKAIDISLPRKAPRIFAASKIMGITAGIFALLLGGAALTYGIASSTVIYPAGSTLSCELGSIDVGLKTTEQAQQLLLQSINNFSYQIKTQAGKKYDVYLTDLTSDLDKSGINRTLAEMKKSCFQINYDTSIADDFTLDDSKIQSFLSRIVREQGEAVPSENAKIVYDETQHTCVIVPEKQGNVLTETAGDTLKNNFSQFNQNIDLMAEGCYVKPEKTSDDPELQAELVTRNNYAREKIVYNVYGNTEELSPDRYFGWLSVDGGGNLSVNQDSVNEYVEELSSKYNTYGFNRTFKTSTGDTVTIKNGDYGWIVNKKKMAEDITSRIVEQDPNPSDLIFAQYAEKLWDGARDFGNSYVEISIDNQNLWMYVNGSLVVDTPIVTGCVSKGHSTPRGIYTLKYKTRDATLKGEDYETPVSFWMPFNGGIGMHDATWRDEFGGSIFQDNGSHGCVNIPFDNAQVIYNNVGNTMPIIVW